MFLYYPLSHLLVLVCLLKTRKSYSQPPCITGRIQHANLSENFRSLVLLEPTKCLVIKLWGPGLANISKGVVKKCLEVLKTVSGHTLGPTSPGKIKDGG